MITLGRLKELFHYDPETGIFTNKTMRCSRALIGGVAGTPSNGYILISIDYVLYRAHRLAWLYMTGGWPKEDIDHKDLNGSNNKFSNLREATDTQNLSNRNKTINNASGYKGVALCKRTNKWRVQIMVNKKKIHVGRFDDKYQAALAYDFAAIELHGKFARTNFEYSLGG